MLDRETSVSTNGDLGITLWTTDIPAMAAFLEKVAGLEVEELHPGYASLRANGASILLHADEAYRGHPWYEALMREGVARGIGAEMRFRVADASAAYSAALRIGGLAIQPPYTQDGIQECQVMGPDGFLFSLWSTADSETQN